MKECYSSNIWGTYKQWQARGAQVRKGEKASLVVFYKEIEREVEHDEDSKSGKLLLARASFVFNADQVDGFSLPTDQVHEDKVGSIPIMQ
jgi:antirestriction protein ArdC